jgi:alkanesulfonate monooxygenase SsuD/methylene tetrahydromethanopterin reductase-like flavin-dependent oxidoreductase (luciferase family)
MTNLNVRHRDSPPKVLAQRTRRFRIRASRFPSRLRVRGPLDIPRGPQGRPVYIQAGSSEDGSSFVARYAEAVFTAHQTVDNAREFSSDHTSGLSDFAFLASEGCRERPLFLVAT